EGSSVLVLEDEAHAEARGAKSLARVLQVATGRGAFTREGAALGAPPGRAVVVVARRDEETLSALATTAGAGVPMFEVAKRAGSREGVGGFGLVAAAATIASGRAEAALVFGLAPDRWAAIVLGGR